MITDFAKEKVFWTRKMNIKLVKFIESRPNIWNPKHPKYTSVQSRDKTYAEFAAKYGNEFTGQAVKGRWTNIRCTFSNYLRKLNASRSKSDAEEYKINWHLWQHCQFLLKVNKNGNGTSNCDKDDEEQEVVSDNEDWADNNEDQAVEDPDNMCRKIAENLALVLRGVQNDSFGLDNTKNGKVGQAVAEKLSQLSPYQAALATRDIIDILVHYDKDNPNNISNKDLKLE